MKENMIEISNKFKELAPFLPLVLQQINIRESKVDITGKCVQVTKLRTNLFPIDNYYKQVTRMIE
jgi:hypothetical protein